MELDIIRRWLQFLNVLFFGVVWCTFENDIDAQTTASFFVQNIGNYQEIKKDKKQSKLKKKKGS